MPKCQGNPEALEIWQLSYYIPFDKVLLQSTPLWVLVPLGIQTSM